MELQNFPRITPFLWFDSNAEEAVNFYLSVFKNSRRLGEMRNTHGMSGPKGSILTISFELDGQKFTAPELPRKQPKATKAAEHAEGKAAPREAKATARKKAAKKPAKKPPPKRRSSN